MIKAVIQAGGKGTRLAAYTHDIPKPMLPLGGKPLLEHQILLLKKYGFSNIIILVNYLGNIIKEYFGDGKKFGVSIEYFEEKKPLGTVGGIKEIEQWLDDDFIVFYGDVMVNMDLNRVIQFHKEKNSECTLVVHPNNHPYDSDLVETDDDGRIINVFAKGQPRDKYYKNLVNAGVYVFSPSFLKHLEKGIKADFGRDIFPCVYKKVKMFGYNTAEYLKDMGTPDRLAEVEEDLIKGKVERLNYEHKRKAVFLDRDGVINHEISFIHKPEQLMLYEFTANAIKKINNTEYLAIVITNQSVIARNLCTLEELSKIHNKMETELGNERAKLDAVYYCPHHPDKGFPEERTEYKIDCECRKPKPGMFLNAARDFNIDLSRSYMIGDSERDIKAGIAAGCITAGVRTGYGLKTTNTQPDYLFQDLDEAVDFILNEPFKKTGDLLIHEINLKNKKPYIIAIGGNARSGKSTLASYLTCHLKNTGAVLRIDLDNWILPENKRPENSDVFQRFRMKDITKDIKDILEEKEITVKKYNITDQTGHELVYSLNNSSVVIIEGIVALSNEYIRNIADYKIFVKSDEKIRVDRLYKYYRWRGKDDVYIKKIIKDRKINEYILIEKDIKFADKVINN